MQTVASWEKEKGGTEATQPKHCRARCLRLEVAPQRCLLSSAAAKLEISAETAMTLACFFSDFNTFYVFRAIYTTINMNKNPIVNRYRVSFAQLGKSETRL